jgi:HK97 gp10 family phage protein
VSATLEDRLPLIMVELRTKVAAAVKAGAELVAEDAKTKVGYGPDPHHIRDDIHVMRKDAAEYSVVAGEPDTYHGHILEHGSVKMAARPFLVPALEENKGAIEGLVEAALRSL